MINMLYQQSESFLEWLEQWQGSLPVFSLKTLVPQPKKAAIASVDVIKGFCVSGALASERVAGIVAPLVRFFEEGWAHGIRHILLNPDHHEPDAVEFSAFPPHCIRGTWEAEDVEEIRALPFYEQMVTLPKNSISSGINTGLNQWLIQHPEVDTFIVVGDCTDLCIYQLAMHLRLDANARQLSRRVIVPASVVDTYDRSMDTALKQGGLPHPGNLLHAVFLYHLALNGVEIAADIRP